MYSALRKALISRVFASEVRSACKYSLIFRGRTENSDEKIAGHWKYVSSLCYFHFNRREQCRFGIEATVFVATIQHWVSIACVSVFNSFSSLPAACSKDALSIVRLSFS